MNDSKRSKKEMQAAKYAGSATALSDQEGRGGEEDAARALGGTKTAVQAQSDRIASSQRRKCKLRNMQDLQLLFLIRKEEVERKTRPELLEEQRLQFKHNQIG